MTFRLYRTGFPNSAFIPRCKLVSTLNLVSNHFWTFKKPRVYGAFGQITIRKPGSKRAQLHSAAKSGAGFFSHVRQSLYSTILYNDRSFRSVARFFLHLRAVFAPLPLPLCFIDHFHHCLYPHARNLGSWVSSLVTLMHRRTVEPHNNGCQGTQLL